MPRPIRNIAIIAHVDHGKTTLVDRLLQQSGTFAAHERPPERVMDSNDLERERGITIFAKNCAIDYAGVHINIVDTPGHADFGGEVERVLGMVDGALLLVDAVEGPMPQTRFVLRKALALGLKPVVVVNKVDRPGARSDWVVNRTFELFDKLGATEAQLDFPVVYASALQGWAATDLSGVAVSSNPALRRLDMRPLFQTILERVPGQDVVVMLGERALGKAKVNQVLGFKGLEREPQAEALAGDIVLVTGIDELTIGATIADVDRPEGLPPLKVDEPTLTMQFVVNTSPFAGTEGKYVTSRNLRERLQRELLTNMALRVEDTGDTDVFVVHGRGELHLTILVENMRREGYELAVGRPKVITRMIDGVTCEPYEMLTVDLEDTHQGAVMEALGGRRGDLVEMQPDGRGRVRIDYRIPARGLIGFQNEFMNLTRGTGIMTHVFDEYGPVKGEIPGRRNGVLVSQEMGEAVAFALFNLQERGRLFVSPGEKVYEGMVVGIHSRDNDLTVNPLKAKKLTNIRAAGKDDNVLLTPPVALTLEYAVEFIADDELVEVTPQSIRIRKRFLKAHERKRADKTASAEN
jgi:GTP-binding protein